MPENTPSPQPTRDGVQPEWAATDEYLRATIAPEDPDLTRAARRAEEAGLPAIAVSPVQGRFLQVLAQACGARRVLEIGTLGGYSAICLARVLPPDGCLVTLEYNPKHAEVARENLVAAGLAERVEVHVGRGLDLLPELAGENPPPFDFTFIDANKDETPEYFDWAVKLSRPGALIVVDNVIRRGLLGDPATADPNVRGMQRLHEDIARDDRVRASTIQTVSERGYDGFLLAAVN